MSAMTGPIADLVPHAGTMVLLEGIEHADADSVACLTTSHRAPDNPLRRGGLLPAVAAVEYGAQAAAVHGALQGRDGGGHLAAIKSLRMHVGRLDDQVEDLRVVARQILADAGAIVYDFTVAAAGATLVEGQVTIFLTREERHG